VAAQILAEQPTLWPETIRALMVHSAVWTPTMKGHLGEIDNKTMLRRYGFGVPDLMPPPKKSPTSRCNPASSLSAPDR
jgi:hypothetical protein